MALKFRNEQEGAMWIFLVNGLLARVGLPVNAATVKGLGSAADDLLEAYRARVPTEEEAEAAWRARRQKESIVERKS